MINMRLPQCLSRFSVSSLSVCCIIFKSLVEAEEPRKTALSQRLHRGCTVDADRLYTVSASTPTSHTISRLAVEEERRGGHGGGEGEGKESYRIARQR